MTAREVFSKTIIFVWAKLGLGLATILLSAILLAICLLVGMLGDAMMVIMMIVWLGGTGAIRFFLNHYIGYLVKAGHVAVITQALSTGRVPDNQFEYGKKAVKERFVTSNVYFVIDKLVAGAVHQLQSIIGKTLGLLSGIPGMDCVKNVLDKFIEIAFGNIDECCLGYTFLNKEQNAYKSAADGVVIYFQNAKELLKNAVKTTVIFLVVSLVTTLVSFAIFSGLFSIFNWSQVIAFAFALFITVVVKTAVLDSWVLVSMMTSYMKLVPTTEITFDLYGKLSGFSSKFKELFNKSKDGEDVAYNSNMNNNQEDNSVLAFCPKCGNKIESEMKFCNKCGAPLMQKQIN